MKNRIFCLSLASSLLGGLLIASYVSNSSEQFLKAEAETRTVYLNAGGAGVWDNTGAKFAAYSWSTETDSAFTGFMNRVEPDSSVFVTEIPSSATKIIFLRMAGSAGTPSWGEGVWNQTVDLTLPTDSNNCFTVSNEDRVDGKYSGSWSQYTEPTYYVELTIDGVKGSKAVLNKNPSHLNEYYLENIEIYEEAEPGVTPIVPEVTFQIYRESTVITPSVKKNYGLRMNNVSLDENTYSLKPYSQRYISIYVDIYEGIWVSGYGSGVAGAFGVGGWDKVYAYTFNEGGSEYAYGAWPGTELTPQEGLCVETHDSVKYGLYLFNIIPNHVGQDNDKIIFHNGLNGDARGETPALRIVDSAYYGAHYTETGDTIRYTPYVVAAALSNAINEQTATHAGLEHSVCSLNPTTAKTYVDFYNDVLTEQQKNLFDAVTFWTYADITSTAPDKNWTMGEIMTRLEIIAGTSGSGMKLSNIIDNDSTFVISVIVFSTIIVGGLFVIFVRKKKTLNA